MTDVDVPRTPGRSRLVSRLAPPRLRAQLEAALAGGNVREVARMDALAPEKLTALAQRSLVLLLTSGAGYVALTVAARYAHRAGPLLGAGPLWLRVAALVAANIAGYVAILPLHEGIHAAVIAALGGSPRFGHKLPFALYCTAPDQLFTRAGYAAVALAPLIILSVGGIIVAWLSPDLGACLALAFAGNVSGAVGDLEAYAHLRSLPASALIADTATGFIAYVAEEGRTIPPEPAC